jgi:molybdopterin synthase catalytic subunit
MLRERAGSDTVDLELPDDARVADALEALSRNPALGDALDRLSVCMAVNREYADPATMLAPGDEVALIPPISGGAGVHARVSDEPLDPGGVAARVGDPGAGALVTFQGVTREVGRLDYEAYREMAEERMALILRECLERHDLLGAAAEHRIGTVPLGEPAVVVAVSAAHREEAFAGAREAIDRIKAEAPIWKRELEGEDVRWVEGTEPRARREAPA